MNLRRNIILCFFACMCNLATSAEPDDHNSGKESLTLTMESSGSIYETCSIDDIACISMAANDKLGLEAIKSLHQKLDDDENGNVDLSESNDFLREELKYDSGFERRQKAFHRNDDMHISVKELWEAWLRSEVHNWTIEQTTEWLESYVQLPQYVPNFINSKVTGANLPRLAVNNLNFLNAIGIKDPIHRQKIALKAMDVVLFGPPKDSRTYWKDLTLVFLLVVGSIGLYYAVYQNKKFKSHLSKMAEDMDNLQKAERDLENLQKELEQARNEQQSVATEKDNLKKLLQETGESGSLHTSYSDLEVAQLKAEIEMLRTELQIAEGELKDRCWSAPLGLQQWLQLTYEVENKSYVKKRMVAERQLQQAREACEKLRKKRSSLVGAFVSTHGKSLDDVDRSIVEARTSLNEVTQELQERMHRWKQIELLCGFNIVNNNGLQYLESTLYRNSGSRSTLRGRVSSQDDLDDDTNSVYLSHTAHADSDLHSHLWKAEADSSESETSKQEDDNLHAQHLNNPVKFHVGEPSSLDELSEKPTTSSVPSPTQLRSISNNNLVAKVTKPSSSIIRSFSQDINTSSAVELNLVKSKSSQSDTCLDNKTAVRISRQKTIDEIPVMVTEDDVCSTDSSVMDDEVKKKKKRKLFGGFSRKNKIKE